MPSTLGIVASHRTVPPVVSDSFNRANSSTTMGTADTGQPWVPQSGVWGISANQACQVGNTPGGQITTVVNAGVADCTIRSRWVVVGDSGMCWRSVDASNHFIIAGPVAYKRVAGGFTQMGVTGATVVDGDVIAITVSGSSHVLTKNGAAWISFSDSFQQTATKHGLRWNNDAPGPPRWDDFSVTVP